MSKSLLTDVEAAIEALDAGRPILVHDGTDREHEVDLLYPANSVDHGAVGRLRNDAGGVLFVALSNEVAETFDLPFLHDAIEHPCTVYNDVGYDTRPSFSLSVNHRDTYTGVTDIDRSRTIRAVAEAARDPVGTDFAAEFRSPGHVHLLRGAPGLLATRHGHTELALALAEQTDAVRAVAGSEMLDDQSGGALSPAAARAYADRYDLIYLDGQDILDTLG